MKIRFDHLHLNPENFEKFNAAFQKLMDQDFMMNMPMEQYGTKVAYEPFPIGMETFEVFDASRSVSAKITSENLGVFCISYRVDNLEEAIKEAYRLSDGVKFEGAYRRSDIGQRALQALK